MAAQQFVNVVDNLGLHGIRKGTDPRAVLGAIRSNGRKLTFTEVAAASQLFNITLDIMIEESTTAENICLGFDTLWKGLSHKGYAIPPKWDLGNWEYKSMALTFALVNPQVMEKLHALGRRFESASPDWCDSDRSLLVIGDIMEVHIAMLRAEPKYMGRHGLAGAMFIVELDRLLGMIKAVQFLDATLRTGKMKITDARVTRLRDVAAASPFQELWAGALTTREWATLLYSLAYAL